MIGRCGRRVGSTTEMLMTLSTLKKEPSSFTIKKINKPLIMGGGGSEV
jgi:transcriptional regulator with XRE-family HTH domain